MPDDGRQPSHHGHSGNGGSSPTFNAFEPLPQLRVHPQRMTRHLGQQPPGHGAAGFGDAAQTLVALAAVTASRREPPVVGQTVRTRKTLHATDATCQGCGNVGTGARYGRQKHSVFAVSATFGDYLLQFIKLLKGLILLYAHSYRDCMIITRNQFLHHITIPISTAKNCCTMSTVIL